MKHKYKYAINYIQKHCLRCKKDAKKFFLHKSCHDTIPTIFGVYSYCNRCFKQTDIKDDHYNYFIEVEKKDLHIYQKMKDVFHILDS